MLPATLINALQVLSRSGKPLVTTDTPNPVGKLEPGQQLQGAVQSQVKPGIFNVLVAGQTIPMRLPDGIRKGDVLNLRVISNTQPLTFSISTSTTPISTREQIGATARLLSDLAELPLDKSQVQRLSGGSIWQANDAAPDSKQLAGALRDALANSGLFYESHQAQWVRGERSTAQLLVEPQNRLLDKRISALVTERATHPDDAKTSAPATLQNNPTSTAVAGDVPPDTRTASIPGTSASPVAKELLPLVQQQLHTLETHQLTWTGQVWPEQRMQWEIQGQPEHRAAMQDSRQWSTEMELALPKLGDVHARLVFSAQGLELKLHAADSATVALFNRAMPGLQSALTDVDISLTAATVEKS